MSLVKKSERLSAFLSQPELSEIEDLKTDPAVSGWALFDGDGEIMEGAGVTETLVAVFSNAVDMSRRIGEELGETTPVPTMLFEHRGMEVTVSALTSANLVVAKRRDRRPEDVRSVR